MMIKFIMSDKELLLAYEPEQEEAKYTVKSLMDGKERLLSHVFRLTSDNIAFYDDSQISFVVGKKKRNYYELDKEVFMCNYNVSISSTIRLERRHFVAYQNISIIKHLSRVSGQDIWIGGKKENAIPVSDYELLIKQFPNSTECRKYADSRISMMIRDYVYNPVDYTSKFNRYLERKNNSYVFTPDKRANTIGTIETEIRIRQLEETEDLIKTLLEGSEGIGEKQWQKIIESVICVVFPKYVYSFREVRLPKMDKHIRIPDYLLMDTNGFIDVMEIKKPEVAIMSDKPSYRNNYVPSKELSGTVQQMEKYIIDLIKWGETGEERLKSKLKGRGLEGLSIRIVNPQGIILAGRRKQFEEQKQADFEVVSRQYKSIAEIITYDDLLERIHNTIAVLHGKMDNPLGKVVSAN